MSDLRAIFFLIALLALVLILFGNRAEAFASTGTLIQLSAGHVPSAAELADLESPDECRNGLYRCVYRTIPFGFMP